jgi:hypothetical protein
MPNGVTSHPATKSAAANPSAQIVFSLRLAVKVSVRNSREVRRPAITMD